AAAIGPTELFEAGPRPILVAVHLEQLHEVHGLPGPVHLRVVCLARVVHSEPSMPRKPKHPRDMTSEELLRHVFPKEVVKHAKRVANPPEKSPKPQVKSTKRKSSD